MIKPFILSLQFLTRLPININVEFDKKNISKSTLFFPFAGMLIGGISALVYYITGFINHDLSAAFSVFTMIFITGGLHLDGLSDTADGFFSSRSRERILEIMKDSRIGAFGVIAIVFDLLFRYVLLKEMPIKQGVVFIIFSCGISRALAGIFLSFGKSVRSSGLGSLFINKESKKYFFIGFTLFTVTGVFFGGHGFLIVLISALLVSLCFMKYSYKIIGGLTGDVCGANVEICEIFSLTAFLVVMKWI